MTYDGDLSNGPSIRNRELDFNPFTGDGPGKLVGLNAGIQSGGAHRGLTAGLNGFASKVAAFTNANAIFDKTWLRMAGAYAAYDANDWEIFAEYYRFFDTDVLTGRRPRAMPASSTPAAVSASGLPISDTSARPLMPATSTAAASTKAACTGDTFVGSRYALDARSSVKLELSHTDEACLSQLDELAASSWCHARSSAVPPSNTRSPFEGAG